MEIRRQEKSEIRDTRGEKERPNRRSEQVWNVVGGKYVINYENYHKKDKMADTAK